MKQGKAKPKANTQIPLSEKEAYSVEEGMAILGVSRQTIYNEIMSGRLGSFKLGRRRIIPSESIATWKSTMMGET